MLLKNGRLVLVAMQGRQGPLGVADRNIKWCSQYGKTVTVGFLLWLLLNRNLQYDPAVALLCVYSRQIKTLVHTKTCVWMFVVVFFIIVKKWKQARCLSVDEWMSKMCLCPYSGILFDNKKKKVLIHSYDMGKPEKHCVCYVEGHRRLCCMSLFIQNVQRRHSFTKKRGYLGMKVGAGSDCRWVWGIFLW